jgi:medium-chain acyl-[acyl-carrier-protein] hydrolase
MHTIHVLVNEYQVHSYDVDLLKRLTVQNVCSFFQESARMHAEALGVSFIGIVPNEKLWMLSRIALSIGRLPLLGEKIVLQTWPSGFRSPFAFRDFDFFDSNNKIIITGTSAWILIDQASRRPQRVEQFTANIPVVQRRNAFNIEIEKIKSVKDGFLSGIINSVYSDLDMNGHVNNTCYIRWIIDSYNKDFHQNHQLKNLSVNFMIETGAGEQMHIVRGQEENLEAHTHSIKRLRDNTEICRVITSWGWRTIF